MQLKSFTAPTMKEAMRLIRSEFGEDAVIVSSHRENGARNVCVTAALEQADMPAIDLSLPPMPRAPGDAAGSRSSSSAGTEIVAALEYHGTPHRVIDRLIDAIGTSGTTPLTALGGALSRYFGFKPLSTASGDAPVAVVGPPGVGKTVTVAKIAARAILAERPVRVISTDGFRAGGVDQLAAFTRILEVELHTAGSPRELAQVAADREPGALVIVDTAGVNPFSQVDLVRLAEIIGSIEAEPVLTLAAGGDAGDAAEIGEAFATIGARRLLLTRLDTARRLGAVLAAADGGGLDFCEVSVSPHVSRGLRPLEPHALARLLLCHPSKPTTACESDEALT